MATKKSSAKGKTKAKPLAPGVEDPNGASKSGAIFGSDIMAEALTALDVP